MLDEEWIGPGENDVRCGHAREKCRPGSQPWRGVNAGEPGAKWGLVGQNRETGVKKKAGFRTR